MTCPVCDGSLRRHEPYAHCSRCGYWGAELPHDVENTSAPETEYELVSYDHTRRANYTAILELLAARHGSGSSLLEIGCADGLFLAMAHERNGYTAIGIEPNVKMTSGNPHRQDIRRGFFPGDLGEVGPETDLATAPAPTDAPPRIPDAVRAPPAMIPDAGRSQLVSMRDSPRATVDDGARPNETSVSRSPNEIDRSSASAPMRGPRPDAIADRGANPNEIDRSSASAPMRGPQFDAIADRGASPNELDRSSASAPIRGPRFDMIALNCVFEHVPDVAQMIEHFKAHLKPGGSVMINVPVSSGFMFHASRLLYRARMRYPFDRIWQRGFVSPHLHYFASGNLETLFARHGFALVSERALALFSLGGLYARLALDPNIRFVQRVSALGFLYAYYPVSRVAPDARAFVFSIRGAG